MAIQENRKTKQVITITICIVIAFVFAIYNHMQIGETKDIKEFFNYGETGEEYASEGENWRSATSKPYTK